MKKLILILAAILFLSKCNSPEQNTHLIDGFKNPGNEARPRAYWNWLNGDVSLEGITRDLEEAKDKGLGGLQMWDTEAMRNPNGFVPAGPPFLGEESVKAIHHSLKEAERLDLDLGLICASGWNSGGAWVTPEMASKNLFHSEIVVNGPAQIKREFPFPEVPENCPRGEGGLPAWYQEVAVLAWPDAAEQVIPDLSKIVNISDQFRDGILEWNVPSGKWHVVRFVCSNNGQMLIAASPNSKGLFIDFLDPKATRFHFEYIFKQIGLEKGRSKRTPLKTLDDDSMELHEGIQWSVGFRQWFREQHGYDPVNWLPVFLGWEIESKDSDDRFLYDYKKAVSDLLIYSHYTTGSEVCNEYGVELVAEAGGPGPPFWNSCPVDALKALGNVDIPRGEFWLENPRNLFLIKEIASASHIYGKKYVDAESWTTWKRWRNSPFERKMLVDRAFCEGLNRVTYHGFSHSPVDDEFPGRSYHAGIDMNPQVVWWDKARPFMDYLARCSYMLQQGLYVADVAYYYGDQAPNFWPYYHNVPEKPTIDGLGSGYEYDVVNSDVILNRMDVEDGRIMLPNGMSYRLLVLPNREDMNLDVLHRLENLVSSGATILGPKPSEVPGLNEVEAKTKDLRALAEKMWGACDGNTVKVNEFGKGKVVWGYSPQEWLEKQSIVPDFTCKDPEIVNHFSFIHRETPLHHIYFVSNKSLLPINAECAFRVENSKPYIWEPSDGSVQEQFIFKVEENGIAMPIELPSGGSTFVVFNKLKSSTGIHFQMKEKVARNNDLSAGKVVAAEKNIAVIECWQNGTYSVTQKNGDQIEVTVNDIPDPKLIKGSWKVEFDPEWGAPEAVEFPELISWTKHEEKGIKFYSGKGIYTKKIEVSDDWIAEQQNIYLDLGEVREVAEVYINGQSAGVVWKPPFRTEITDLVKPGENELKVEVLNLWINRLTGDKDLPEEDRFTKTNIQSDGGSWLSNYSDWHVEPAGLFGPVRLLLSKEVEVN